MNTIAQIVIAVVAIEHLLFLWIEMFAWETVGKKTFKNSLSADFFKPTKVLAANQGLYNGFLAAGLLWTFFITDEVWKINISVFFLSCVVIAGIFGAATAGKKILYIQALPAAVGLVFIVLS